MMNGMDMYTFGKAATVTSTALFVAMIVTGFMVGYAHRNGMLDHPGQRRSHRVPTPRGGGLGLVLGALAGVYLALHGMIRPPYALAVLLAAGLLVAFIGWLDDRRGLSPWPRLVTHLVASCAFSLVLVQATGWSPWLLAPLVLAATWSINLHNFMDGIDGILGVQLLFIGLVSAALCLDQGYSILATAHLALSASATGFLVFNLPPARIFMGDVGSGFAGLLVFMLGALWCADELHAVWALLILHAAFATDAGLTLASRMLRGRRWYTAHREHLYQWMVRSGFTHGQTVCLYLIFNVLVLAPLAWLALHAPAFAPWICAATYLVTATTWLLSRTRCLLRIQRGGRYASG
jgi:UDP-N-acetylmuramyl pentapeptide phosphotransferase/UDP-N-acetylglucosamine-1-phosphate transferase